MEAVGFAFGVFGATALVGAMIWLIARGFKDAAFPDVILFLTGVSLIAYVFTRWDRAKLPVLVALGGFVATFVGLNVANTFSQERHAWQAFDQGVEAMDREKFDLAIKCFSEAISVVPDDPACFYSRGGAYIYKGEYDRAIADYTQAIRLDPIYVDAYNNRGQAYINKGDHVRAIADYTEAIKLEPTFAVAYFNRGVAYAGKGDHDLAIAEFTQAIRLNPDFAEAYVDRGNSYRVKGDTDKAAADFAKAEQLAEP